MPSWGSVGCRVSLGLLGEEGVNLCVGGALVGLGLVCWSSHGEIRQRGGEVSYLEKLIGVQVGKAYQRMDSSRYSFLRIVVQY